MESRLKSTEEISCNGLIIRALTNSLSVEEERWLRSEQQRSEKWTITKIRGRDTSTANMGINRLIMEIQNKWGTTFHTRFIFKKEKRLWESMEPLQIKMTQLVQQSSVSGSFLLINQRKVNKKKINEMLPCLFRYNFFGGKISSI